MGNQVIQSSTTGETEAPPQRFTAGAGCATAAVGQHPRNQLEKWGKEIKNSVRNRSVYEAYSVVGTRNSPRYLPPANSAVVRNLATFQPTESLQTAERLKAVAW